MNEQQKKPEPEWDPTYLHALRETYVIIGLFGFFCIWSIFVCYNYGYLSPGEQRSTVTTVFGMPSWAFWGLCLPWLVVDIIAIVALFQQQKTASGRIRPAIGMSPTTIGWIGEARIPTTGCGMTNFVASYCGTSSLFRSEGTIHEKTSLTSRGNRIRSRW